MSATETLLSEVFNCLSGGYQGTKLDVSHVYFVAGSLDGVTAVAQLPKSITQPQRHIPSFDGTVDPRKVMVDEKRPSQNAKHYDTSTHIMLVVVPKDGADPKLTAGNSKVFGMTPKIKGNLCQALIKDDISVVESGTTSPKPEIEQLKGLFLKSVPKPSN